jgi:hypothetical protein
MLNDDIELFDEEDEEDLSNTDVKRFEEAVIWGTDWTAETIVTQLEKGNIDLKPKFQRRDAWSIIEKSRLIESLILGIPVPPIILAERKDKRGKYIVIDGKQRLLSLRQFCSKDDEFKSYKLKGLTLLTELNGKSFDSLDNDLELSEYKNQFENQTLRTIVIKNWPHENFLFTIFLRLNTGSKKLSPQELRQALHPGEFLDYLDEESGKSKQLLKLLNNKEPDSRMRDVELSLRYYAFKYCITEYKGNLKDFLDLTCKVLNEKWSSNESQIKQSFYELDESIKFTMDIFGEKEAFSRFIDNKYNNKFNRALFEVFTYYFSIESIRDELMNNTSEFKRNFEELSRKDSKFNDAIASTTKEIGRVEYRFECIYNILGSMVNCQLPKLQYNRTQNKFEIL